MELFQRLLGMTHNKGRALGRGPFRHNKIYIFLSHAGNEHNTDGQGGQQCLPHRETKNAASSFDPNGCLLSAILVVNLISGSTLVGPILDSGPPRHVSRRICESVWLS